MKKENYHCLQVIMIPYIENPKDTTRKSREFIKEFSKVVGYKINIQKSVAFLQTNNELSKVKLSKKNPTYNCIQKNKIPRGKSKEVKDLCSENC